MIALLLGFMKKNYRITGLDEMLTRNITSTSITEFIISFSNSTKLFTNQKIERLYEVKRIDFRNKLSDENCCLLYFGIFFGVILIRMT